jgi:hypothetical protein
MNQAHKRQPKQTKINESLTRALLDAEQKFSYVTPPGAKDRLPIGALLGEDLNGPSEKLRLPGRFILEKDRISDASGAVVFLLHHMENPEDEAYAKRKDV